MSKKSPRGLSGKSWSLQDLIQPKPGGEVVTINNPDILDDQHSDEPTTTLEAPGAGSVTPRPSVSFVPPLPRFFSLFMQQ